MIGKTDTFDFVRKLDYNILIDIIVCLNQTIIQNYIQVTVGINVLVKILPTYVAT